MHSEKQPFMLLFSEYFYDEWPTVLWFYSSPSSEDTTIFIFRIYISTMHFIYSCLTTAGNSQLCAHTFTSGGRQQSSASAIALFTNFTRASTKQQHNDDETLYVLDQTDNTQSEHALTVIENANVTRRRAKMLPLTWRSEPWLSTCVRKRRARRHGCGIENCYWGSNMERQRALWEFNSWRDREREGHRKTVKENIAADCEQLSGKLSGFDVRSTIYDAG